MAYNFTNEGFKVKSESSGKGALTLSKSFEPDIIILDLMLPDMSGIDVCKKIKNSDEYPDPSIIMLTAKGEEVDRIIGFEVGADDYVTKPFSIRELILRVKVIIKKQANGFETDNKISLGPLNLNLSAHEVSINGDEILLTALEFKLLKHLHNVEEECKLVTNYWVMCGAIVLK